MRAAGDPSEEHPAHLEGGASSQGGDTAEAPERLSKSQGEEGAARAKAHQSEKGSCEKHREVSRKGLGADGGGGEDKVRLGKAKI